MIKYFLVLFHQLFKVTAVYVCGCDETLCTFPWCNFNTTYHILGTKQTNHLH